jgi:hypothetical protein
VWSHTLGDYIFIVILMLHLQLPPSFIMNSYIDRNLAIKKLIYKRVTLATRTNDCLVVQRYHRYQEELSHFPQKSAF